MNVSSPLPPPGRGYAASAAAAVVRRPPPLDDGGNNVFADNAELVGDDDGDGDSWQFGLLEGSCSGDGGTNKMTMSDDDVDLLGSFLDDDGCGDGADRLEHEDKEELGRRQQQQQQLLQFQQQQGGDDAAAAVSFPRDPVAPPDVDPSFRPLAEVALTASAAAAVGAWKPDTATAAAESGNGVEGRKREQSASTGGGAGGGCCPSPPPSGGAAALRGGPSRRAGKKKPKGMPKRPLSSYNIFFKRERLRIYERTGSKRVTFEELGKEIGRKWRELSQNGRREYDALAEEEIRRYRKERDAYEESLRKKRFCRSRDREDGAGATGTAAAGATAAVAGDLATRPPPRSYEDGRNEFDGVTPPEDVVSFSPAPAKDWDQDWSSMRRGCSFGQDQQHNMPTLPAVPYAPQQPRHRVSFSHLNPLTNQQSATYSSPFGTDRNSIEPGQPPRHDRDHPPRALPSGLEIYLTDQSGRHRLYRIEYTRYRMTRAQADEYVYRLSDYVARYGRQRHPQPAPAATGSS